MNIFLCSLNINIGFMHDQHNGCCFVQVIIAGLSQNSLVVIPTPWPPSCGMRNYKVAKVKLHSIV